VRFAERILRQGERAVRRQFVAADRRDFRQGGQNAP
jgi:hypothetical protein